MYSRLRLDCDESYFTIHLNDCDKTTGKLLRYLRGIGKALFQVVRVFRVNGYAMSIYRPALFESKEQPFLAVRNECRVPLGQDHNKKKRREKKNQVMTQHRPMQPCTRKFSASRYFHAPLPPSRTQVRDVFTAVGLLVPFLKVVMEMLVFDLGGVNLTQAGHFVA